MGPNIDDTVTLSFQGIETIVLARLHDNPRLAWDAQDAIGVQLICTRDAWNIVVPVRVRGASTRTQISSFGSTPMLALAKLVQSLDEWVDVLHVDN